jgi:hypothetical protein
MFPEIVCLPPVATKTTGVSLSRRLSRDVHFPPVRARDDPRRRGSTAKTGQLRDEATGGRQSQGCHFSTAQEFRKLDASLARVRSIVYFLFFLLMPWYTARDKVIPVPERVTV